MLGERLIPRRSRVRKDGEDATTLAGARGGFLMRHRIVRGVMLGRMDGQWLAAGPPTLGDQGGERAGLSDSSSDRNYHPTTA